YALFQRERTGRGTHVDIAMTDAMFHMHEFAVQASSLAGDRSLPLRQGRHYQPASPAGSFQGPDGWIVVLATQAQIGGLWSAMGRPELGDDPRFVSNEARVEHRDALTALIEEWMAGFDSDDDVLDTLAAARVPCGPVLNPADAVDHPHFQARGTVREITDPVAGTFHVPGFPIRYSARTDPLDLTAPGLGEHNAEVLTELMGLDERALADLTARGILITGA
ncbi:MAG: CoA transferase, partial [Acidimicrobiales bacterium]